MKSILCSLFLILVFAFSAIGQSDWNTYPARSIAQIIEMHSGPMSLKAELNISADPFPSKTTVVYTGKSRPIGQYTKDFIELWAQTRNLPASNAAMLTTEFLFKEQGKEYWIPAIKTIVPFLGKELKEGDEIVVFYFFLGGYNKARLIKKDSRLKDEKAKAAAAANEEDKVTWVFALEEFQKPKRENNSSGSAYITQPLAAAVDKDTKNAKRADEFLIDPRQVKSKSKVIYTGEIREVSETKKRFLKTWAESQGLPLGILPLLAREAHFREGDKDYWLPISKKIAEDMAAQLKKNDEIVIHTILAGGIPESNSVDWIFIVGDFSK